jgi:hypothetical protein
MRAKWRRVVVSSATVFAANKPGSKYHSFSHYRNERGRRKLPGNPDVCFSNCRAGAAEASVAGFKSGNSHCAVSADAK